MLQFYFQPQTKFPFGVRGIKNKKAVSKILKRLFVLVRMEWVSGLAWFGTGVTLVRNWCYPSSELVLPRFGTTLTPVRNRPYPGSEPPLPRFGTTLTPFRNHPYPISEPPLPHFGTPFGLILLGLVVLVLLFCSHHCQKTDAIH